MEFDDKIHFIISYAMVYIPSFQMEIIPKNDACDVPTPSPVKKMTDRRLWKHYLPTASLAGGKKIHFNKLCSDDSHLIHYFY